MRKDFEIIYHAGSSLEIFSSEDEILEFYDFVAYELSVKYPFHGIEIDDGWHMVDCETNDHHNRQDISDFCNDLLGRYLNQNRKGV